MIQIVICGKKTDSGVVGRGLGPAAGKKNNFGIFQKEITHIIAYFHKNFFHILSGGSKPPPYLDVTVRIDKLEFEVFNII